LAKRDHAAGASKALNKTITEIMAHMGDDGDRPGAGLRDFLHEKVGDLAEGWFKKGFNRGHREAHGHYKEDGKVPKTLKFECRRKLSPKQERDIKLRSTIKKPKKTLPGAS